MKKTKDKPANNKKTVIQKPQSRPLLGLLLLTIGLLLLVAFIDYKPEQNSILTTAAGAKGVTPNLVGYLGVTLSFWMNYLFGLVAWLFPAFFFWTGYLLIFKKARLLKIWRYTAMATSIVTLCGLLNLAQDHLITNPNFINANYYPDGAGGYLGFLVFGLFLKKSIGVFGSGFILSLGFSVGIVLTFARSYTPSEAFDNLQDKTRPWFVRVPRYLKTLISSFFKKLSTLKISLKNVNEAEYIEERELDPSLNDEPKKISSPKKRIILPEPSTNKEKQPEPKTPENASTGIKIIAGEVTQKASISLPKKRGNYIFPKTDILNPALDIGGISEEEHKETAQRLVRTLSEFGVEVQPGEVHTGPVVTRYEVIPAPGVRVEKILNLDKNIALSLKAHSVRILAPVPGKGTVGIEIPNKNPAPVCLREIIESTAWSDSQSEIPIVLGKEVTGKPLVYDLTKMPHLLIAGSTGSGKTVCINTIIASLLYHSSPQDLRFIMVDPKIVEMQQFNDLPHMLIPVVTKPKKVPAALKWLIKEMERRYQIFAQANVRNIAGFNAKILKDRKENEKAQELEAELSPEERAAINNIEVPRDSDLEMPKEKLPYIVCIIDELADLMMVAAADVETCIARLAQLARAAGIHLIIATQRPSVNVITGVIKANLPSRIAFKVASKVDSRTILDVGGADHLIGRGDMLFIPPGSSNMVRAQGAYLSDSEIDTIIDAVKVNGPPEYADHVQREIEEEGEEENEAYQGNWDDELVPAAIDVLRTSKRASTSMLQRRLKIGYNRAARIMDLLEDEGIVGPDNGQSPREILKDFDMAN